MATMKDVAKKANVSIATVSNYINGTKAVSEKNAERISNAIENLNYIPNQIARNLKSEKTKNIAVILPNIYDNYYQQIFESIQRFFTDKSFGVTIATTNDIKELEKNTLMNFLKKKWPVLFWLHVILKIKNFFMENFSEIIFQLFYWIVL